MSTQTTPGTGAQPPASTMGAVGQETKGAAADVASTATDEARAVVRETGQQARALWEQTRSDLTDQAATQQHRAAESLRTLADQLQGMASNGDDGLARDLVDDVARRTGDVAGWLEQRDPGTLLEEARGFARRRPGTFLAIAAGVGVLAGRMGRSLVDEKRDEHGTAGDGPTASTGTMPGTSTPDDTTPTTTTTPVTPGASPQSPTVGSALPGSTPGEASLPGADRSEADLAGRHRTSQPLQPDGTLAPVDDEGRLTAIPDDPAGGGRR